MTAPVDGIGDYENGSFTAEGSTTDPTFTAASYNRWRQQGKTVDGYGYGVFATAGEGVYGVALPVTPREGFQPVGPGVVIDVSEGNKLINASSVILANNVSQYGLDAGAVTLSVTNGQYNSGSNPVGAAVPFTFAAGDIISFKYTYEAD